MSQTQNPQNGCTPDVDILNDNVRDPLELLAELKNSVEQLFADLEKITGIPYAKMLDSANDRYEKFSIEKTSVPTDKILELHAEAIHQKRRFVRKHQYEKAAYMRDLEKMYEYIIAKRIENNHDKTA